MKKLLALILVLAAVFALAACGGTEKAEVVENVDPGDNTMVIETPPAIVSGPDTPVDQYPPVATLPTTAPTTVPEVQPTVEPVATTAPDASAGNTDPESGSTGNSGSNEEEFEYADDSGESYNPTATQAEKNNATIGYTTVDWANFRVGPGEQYKIYESLPKGAQVKVLGYEGNWAKIWYNDYLVGYVWKAYISSKAPSSVNVVTATPTPTEEPAPTVVVITP